MSTPPRKFWTGWSLSPRSEPADKGKGVAFMGTAQKSLTSQDYGNMDQEALIGEVSKLENELFSYQYSMGLLLIEKKDWSSKFEEIKQALEEANGAYRREQAAHSIAISEVEKREENLRKALGVEKQCVLELEKELREMRSEYAETKYTADSKLAEANALAASVEVKSLEVEAKLRAADAKLAEVNQKSSVVERKLNEVEAQENVLRRERSSFNAEREAFGTYLSRQREDLQEWERKLQAGEERLADGRRLLNQREQRANDTDRILMQKENDLEDDQRKIDAANSVLRKKEDDMSSRIANLTHKEKELEDVRKSLEIKERELLDLQEKLNFKEREGIQNLMDEHRSILHSKEEEFELELRQRRASLDEELKGKVLELETKEAEVDHMEEKIKKREQAFEKKLEKVKEKEKDHELKLKSLKEREKSLKTEEKILETERKQIVSEKENLLALMAELENVRADIEKQQVKISDETEQLKVTEDERMEHARLQSELKQEIDKCRLLQENLLKEAEDLKQEKERFEKEWEELDEKRSEIKIDLQELNEQRKNFEKLKRTEEEMISKEKLETENYVQRELEALRVARETFEATMDHEKSILAEQTRSEKSQMLHAFEWQKRELESDMLRKQEEKESALHVREKLFEEERQRELSNIEYLKEVAHREMEEMKLERVSLEKEKQEISANKGLLEVQQLEMKKDIDVLVGLSRKLKDQRLAFIEERDKFIAFVKQQKSCSSCGEGIRVIEFSDLQALAEAESFEAPPLPSVVQEYLHDGQRGSLERTGDELSPGARNTGSMVSGGTMSWLRKCTSKILKFSPSIKIENASSHCLVDGSSASEKCADISPNKLSNEGNHTDLAVSMNVLDDQRLQQGDGIREVEVGQGTVEDSHHASVKIGQLRPVKKGSGRSSKTAKATDTRTVLEKVPKEGENMHANGSLETSVNMNEESQRKSGLLGGAPRNSRKRGHMQTSQEMASEIDGNNSEGQSDSVANSRRKRRQQVAPGVQAHAERRYNLRRPKSAAPATANGSLSDPISKSQEENWNSNASLVTPLVDNGADDGKYRNFAAGHPTVAESPLNDTVDNQEGSANIATELVDDTGLSEEVNETPKQPSAYDVNGDGDGCDDSDGDEGDEEEEIEHPGEVSIGKKLWTFITT
ncbi:nuclear matrix constituent protein 1-like isoform X1 [Nicotiana tomentosiformis]|uniref:nuclear matrix constituent protein 1-like isoform X1 n=2 Tax=Nicotiana tomentosiformis TaxID=4098 RepID=UPI00051AAC8E|nr:protein CROWDED NUCLEI 1-like isoform X1 [Nicotiana tomentosiformis]XP_009598067.1 protein CROWDED NUCLEI 1-like isoform X1 [Nicotiana tomentosiformis]